ncbi:MAG TPA: SCO family protein [Gallionella sp.]|nr:SCO family protein [Gallionella sp.]
MFLLFATIVLGLLAGRATAAPKGSPWGANYFPNISLVNQDGKTLRFYDDMIKGKVVAINFMYATCHDSCPLETAKLRKVQEALGDRVGRDIFMYSITIAPEHDTPESLKAYMEKFNVGPGWQFLTGKEADITLLRKKLGLYDGEEQEKSEGHTMSMIVGNEATGQWIKRSSFDNPNVMARVLGEELFNYKTRVGQHNSYADAPRIGKLDHGEDLFVRRCQSCHTVGAGDALGPDLLGVVGNRDRGWLQRWLKNPDQVLAAKDPIATALYARYKQVTMPNLRLNDGEVEALINYLETESGRIESLKLASSGSESNHQGHGGHDEHSAHHSEHGEHPAPQEHGAHQEPNERSKHQEQQDHGAQSDHGGHHDHDAM